MTNWYDNVPAPLDSNGIVVPLDTKELVYRGETREVCGFSYSTRHGCWGVVFENVGSISLDACTMTDGWEKLEQGAAKTPCDYFGVDCPNGCDGCPAESDATDPHICYAAMARDLIRRAKALAGRGEDE